MRDERIDILKGLGMIMVVWFHANGPATSFITLFFMSIFFISSGYTHNSRYSTSIKSWLGYMKKLAVKLYVTYVVFNLVLTVLHNPLISMHLIDSDYYKLADIPVRVIRVLLFIGSENWAGATWFIRVLFLAMIPFTLAHLVLDRFGEKVYFILQGIVSVVLMCAICTTKVDHTGQLVAGIFQCMGAYPMLYLGECLKRFRCENTYLDAGLAVVSAVVLYLMQPLGPISYGFDFVSPWVFFVTSLCGWFFTWGLSIFFLQIPYVSKALQHVGKHTLVILYFHFIAFVLVNGVVTLIYGMGVEQLCSYPIIADIPGAFPWWIVYIAVGVTAPLLLEYIFKSLKHNE